MPGSVLERRLSNFIALQLRCSSVLASVYRKVWKFYKLVEYKMILTVVLA